MRRLTPALLILALLAAPAAAREALSNAEFVKQVYNTYLERDPDPSGIATYVGGLDHGELTRAQVLKAVLTSPEFRELRARKAKEEKEGRTVRPGDPEPPVSGEAPPAADPAAPPADPAGGTLDGLFAGGDPQALGTVPLEGYDAEKLNDPAHRSPKYLFGRVASRHPLTGVKSHADAEALLKRMWPEMKASGLEVKEISRDRILVKTEVGWEWVDVVRGAGGGNPGWWWGSEGKPAAGVSGASPGGAAGVPPGATGGPGKLPPPLASVPDLPEYRNARIDTSSDARAVLTTAEYVKAHYAHLFPHGDTAERAVRRKCVEVMTVCIGILRANGYDASRVLNHPSLPADDPFRYGSDAVVVNGLIYDIFGGMGESNTPQALMQGPYGNRPRE